MILHRGLIILASQFLFCMVFQTLDIQTSRQILELYAQVSCVVPCHLHIHLLLEAIAARLSVVCIETCV